MGPVPQREGIIDKDEAFRLIVRTNLLIRKETYSQQHPERQMTRKSIESTLSHVNSTQTARGAPSIHARGSQLPVPRRPSRPPSVVVRADSCREMRDSAFREPGEGITRRHVQSTRRWRIHEALRI